MAIIHHFKIKMLKNIHHIAIICSNYEVSKVFYTEKLGFEILQEVYRKERKSFKLDLCLNGMYCIELFSFENFVKRPSYPEACGLRHLAFSVENIHQTISILKQKEIECEAVRTDPYTGKLFTFFQDPDGLPIELYEI